MSRKILSLTGALWALFYCHLAFAAGTVPGFSLTPQFDLTGKIMPGCRLYVIQAGTVSTPQIAYQDSGLTLPSPGGSTLTCDAAGRLPQFFLADGSIKLRLTTATGTQIFVGDGLLVVGASSGGGGGSPVDPTTILATGDVKMRHGSGVLSGFVRENGRTIGSATSGATERANSDCQALFEYLWNTDATLVVSTGRGGSANADWVANKTIALPDARSRALAGLGDMGNSDNALFAGVTFGSGNSTTLGSWLGAARRTLAALNIPTITSSVTPTNVTVIGRQASGTNGGGGTFLDNIQGTGGGGTSSFTYPIAPPGATSNNTGGQAFDSVSPFLLITVYLKL